MSPLTSWWHLSKGFSKELDLIIQLQVKVCRWAVLSLVAMSHDISAPLNKQECKSDCRMQNYGNFRIIFQGTDGIIFPAVQPVHIRGAPVWVAVLGFGFGFWFCLVFCLFCFVLFFFNINEISKCKLELNVNRSEIINVTLILYSVKIPSLSYYHWD